MKTSELRDLTIEELTKKGQDLRRELMLARFAKANQQLKNPFKVRELRREVARVLTIINEKAPQKTRGGEQN
ncbi:MAG: 50S ribosomal protein L29 [Candidatus Margulisbacteria bacterium]|nr:50S ribosomal protein L29 [Candidatus Margulisiibacteriota bacterium]